MTTVTHTKKWSAEYIYDWEVYPNFACVTFYRPLDNAWWFFEVSQWRNDALSLYMFLCQVSQSKGRCVGFNNEAYDYPVTHAVMAAQGYINSAALYAKSQAMFQCMNDKNRNREHFIWDRDRFIQQVDLFKIHHFDNKAKSTSLKVLEFTMRMDSIEELPFDPTIPLTFGQARAVAKYNRHDVEATYKFFLFSQEQIAFRDELSEKYDRDFTNFNDTRIGAEIVKLELEKRGVTVNKNIQTHRDRIVVNDIIFPYIKFESPEFNQVLDFFRRSVIDPTKIKGFFKESVDDDETKFTSATIKGFTFDFGAGGIHGSVRKEIIVPGEDEIIWDADVASFYPNIGIQNKLYPLHLGVGWCDVMDWMFHERIKVGKKTSMGNGYKLGLNGSYGKSNDVHSPFYDPQYTMAITINGQLLLCMLAEQLLKVPGLRMIQVNTDGLTFTCPKAYIPHCMAVSEWWESLTKLELEHTPYDKMIIRDVNSYIAVKSEAKITGHGMEDDPGHGGLKRIGAYAYERPSYDEETGKYKNIATRELPWHKDHSAIVVAKAAEARLVYNKPIGEFILEHMEKDPYDFMLRTKVPRSSRLLLVKGKGATETPFSRNVDDVLLADGESIGQNITRYYVANSGRQMVKLMPPTDKQIEAWNVNPHWYHVDTGAHKCCPKAPSGKWQMGVKPAEFPPMRRMSIQSGFTVKDCNKLTEDDLMLKDIDLSYYVKQTEKLVKELIH